MTSKTALTKENDKLRGELSNCRREFGFTKARLELEIADLSQKLSDAEVDNREQGAHITRLLQEAVGNDFELLEVRMDAFTERINLVRSAYSSRNEPLPPLPDVPRVWGEIEVDGELVRSGPIVRMSQKQGQPREIHESFDLVYQLARPIEEVHVGFEGDPKNYVVRLTGYGDKLTIRTPHGG